MKIKAENDVQVAIENNHIHLTHMPSQSGDLISYLGDGPMVLKIEDGSTIGYRRSDQPHPTWCTAMEKGTLINFTPTLGEHMPPFRPRFPLVTPNQQPKRRR
jgi:hypothetical protein